MLTCDWPIPPASGRRQRHAPDRPQLAPRRRRGLRLVVAHYGGEGAGAGLAQLGLGSELLRNQQHPTAPIALRLVNVDPV